MIVWIANLNINFNAANTIGMGPVFAILRLKVCAPHLQVE